MGPWSPTHSKPANEWGTRRWEPEWRRQYVRLALKKNRLIAAVAMARKLAVRLWWLWKSGLASGQIGGSGSHAESPV
jgi:hypothetical protein